MNKRTDRNLSIVVAVILVVQIGGVVSILVYNAVHKHRYHRDLLDTEELALQFASVDGIELQEPRALVRGKELVVDGCLHREEDAVPMVSHVTVGLLSAQGVSIGRSEAKLSKCKLGGVYFRSSLAVAPRSRITLEIKVLADQVRPMPSAGG